MMKDAGFRSDCLFILGVVCAMAAGGVTGAYFTWGFILVCSFVLVGVCYSFWLTLTNKSGLRHALVLAGIPLFLVCCWCSFWISLTGVLRK